VSQCQLYCYAHNMNYIRAGIPVLVKIVDEFTHGQSSMQQRRFLVVPRLDKNTEIITFITHRHRRDRYLICIVATSLLTALHCFIGKRKAALSARNIPGK